MNVSTAMELALAIPFAGTILILLTGRWPNLRDTITVLTSAALFWCVLQIIADVAAGGRPGVTLIEIFPGLPISLRAEPLGAVFAGIASLLWINAIRRRALGIEVMTSADEEEDEVLAPA